MRRSRLMLAPLAVGVSALALSACGGGGGGGGGSTSGGGGGGSNGGGGSSSTTASFTPSSSQQKGGTLKVISNEGFEHLDPGQSYFQLDYAVVYAVQRPLYSFKPDQPTQAVPDIAASQPQVSKDGKTVTIKLKSNVRYSPPVNRAVKAQDVKYAIERGFTSAVPNGYAPSYFGDLVGASKASSGGHISGIQTPDDHTIVFKLNSPFGATFAKALSLPLTAPVPQEYASKFDKSAPSKYETDPTVQAFTGPYVIKSYSPSRGVTLARNKNWNAKTDYRPAYANSIQWTTGVDSNVAGRQTLAGQGMIMGDTPPATVVKQAVTRAKSQIAFPSLGNRYMSMNTQLPPFDNINVRKAVIAAMDRTALRLARGGQTIGDVATHFLPPSAPGFQAAGGMKGPGYDYLNSPSGNMALAQKYLKKAGYSSGKYTGSDKVLFVADNEDPGLKDAQIALGTLKQLGFKVNFRSVPHQTMYSKFCNVPKSKVNFCSNVGWLPDFPDGYAYLYVTFNGHAIAPVNNSNWPQLKDAKVDAAMAQAEKLTGSAREQAWGKVDRMITADAPAVPWLWDKQPNLESKGVHGVIAQWNADWDLSYTSVQGGGS